jgi:hypothetical protein
LIGMVRSVRAGNARMRPVKFGRSTSSHSGTPRTLRKLERFLDAHDLVAALAYGDDVTDLEQRRGDVDLAAVHQEVTVPHELPRLGARVREAESVDHVVEPPLEQDHQRFAGDALRPVRFLEQLPELPLEQAVHALQLLLLAELEAVLGELHAPLAMLAGRIVATLDGALVGVAPLSLEEEFQTFTPAKPAY